MVRTLNIIKRAVEEFGYELQKGKTLEEVWCECEQLLEDGVEYDRMEQCDLDTLGMHQTFTYDDGKGYRKTESGDIFDCGRHYDAGQGKFFRLSTQTYLDWYDLPKEPDRDYVFIYAKVVDSDARVVALYDFLN